MKKIFTVILSSIFCIGLLSCGGDKKQEASAPKDISNMELATATLSIEGMTCQKGCANKIEKALKENAHVANATVSFAEKNAIVQYDNKTTNPNELIAMINELDNGKYKASGIKSTPAAVAPIKKPVTKKVTSSSKKVIKANAKVDANQKIQESKDMVKHNATNLKKEGTTQVQKLEKKANSTIKAAKSKVDRNAKAIDSKVDNTIQKGNNEVRKIETKASSTIKNVQVGN